MREFNPNHPVTRAAHDNWHKFVALIMHKLGSDRIEFTIEDVQSLTSRFPGQIACVVCREQGQKIVLSLVSEKEARRLASGEEVN